jgi:mono/diheme cytochrome c family protein
MLRISPFLLKAPHLSFLSALLAVGPLAADAGTVAHAADKSGPGSGRLSAKRGSALFHQRCAVCHNKQPGNDSPFGPPNLYDVFREKKITVTQAKNIIYQGEGPMPSFGKSISDAQIRDVIAYLDAH